MPLDCKLCGILGLIFAIALGIYTIAAIASDKIMIAASISNAFIILLVQICLRLIVKNSRKNALFLAYFSQKLLKMMFFINFSHPLRGYAHMGFLT